MSLHIPPAAPTSLSASAAQTSLTLSWTNPSSDSAVSAEVQIRPASGSWPQAWTASGSSASHTFSGLTADTNYEMRVRATNSATDPGPAASLSKRTLAAPPTSTPVPTATPMPTSTPVPRPSAPTGLNTSGITQTSITLNWTKSSGATYYEVRRGTTGGFTRLGDVASHIFTGLNAGTSYTLQVRAGNTGGTSSTAQTTASTNNVPPPPAPSAPTGLNTSGITQTSITLNWTKSSGATYYEVRRGTTGGFTRLGNVASHVFTGLNAGTSYTLQVRAGNTGGTSSTAQTTASTNNVPPPPAPSAPTGLSASGITQTSITLNWTKSSGATYYEVRRGTTGGFTRLGNVASHIFTGLNAGTSYTLQVRAGNTGGTSSTAQTTASTNNVPPPVSTPTASQPAVNPPPVNPPAAADRPARSSSSTAAPTAQATPGFYQSLNDLPPDIEVNNWAMGAQGRRVDASGVGNQAIVDQGLLDAIDMWGYIAPGTEVCFAQFGRLMLLDAAYSPRRAMPLSAYQRNGMTCATLDRAGTVVLLQSAEPLPVVDDTAMTLPNCMVRLLYALHFRDAPAGHIMSVLPANILLTAFDYHQGWFKVDFYGQKGWVSANYVQTHGNCG